MNPQADSGTTAVHARELLVQYEGILAQLRDLGVVRTNDAPAGQFAEWLAMSVIGGTLAPNSQKGYDLDLTGSTWGKVQVKSRVLRENSARERQLSPFRSDGYDHALVILFDRDYSVWRAAMMPRGILDKCGGRVRATDELLKSGEDLTDRFTTYLRARA